MNKIKLVKAQFIKVCPICGYEHSITLHDITEQQRVNYKFNIIPIQDNFPHLNPTEREFLKSGICTRCQRQLFTKKAQSKHIRIIY